MFSQQAETSPLLQFAQTTLLPLAAQYLQIQQIQKTQEQYAEQAKTAAQNVALMTKATGTPIQTIGTLTQPKSGIPWTWILIGGGGLIVVLLLTGK